MSDFRKLGLDDYINNLRDELQTIFNEKNREDPKTLRHFILITHLHIEQLINELIYDITIKPNIIINEKSGEFSLSKKVKILISLGILDEEWLISNLKLINTLRNTCAHKFDIDYSDLKDKMGNIRINPINSKEILKDAPLIQKFEMCILMTIARLKIINTSDKLLDSLMKKYNIKKP